MSDVTQILSKIETARRKKRHIHGGEWNGVPFDSAQIPCDVPDDELLALHAALEKLQQEDPFKVRLIVLRIFAGLTNEDAAVALQVSPAMAKRHWRFTRAWLHRAIHGTASLPQE